MALPPFQTVRPSALPPRANPVGTEVVPSDNGSTVAGVTWVDGVNAGRPFATREQAEAGVSSTTAMSPLTTQQAIEAQTAGFIDNIAAVSYKPQTLTPTDQGQARENVSLDYFINPRMFGGFTATNFRLACEDGRAIEISAEDTAITLTSTGQTRAFLSALSRLSVLGPSLTVTLPSGIMTVPAVALVTSPKIRILGPAVVESNITAITSVTGSAGAWDVTATVTSSAGMSVGDTIKVSRIVPGVRAPGLNTGRPEVGEIQLQFFQLGSLTSSGATYTVSGGTDIAGFIASGDFLVADGRVRRITAINSASSFTTTAIPGNLPSSQYWYTMRAIPAGLVTISGTTMTCSGDFFGTFLTAGDIVGVAGYGMRRVVSVDSLNTATLDRSGMDVPAGAQWGVIRPGETHEGAYVISSISGNQVTWRNTSRDPYPPATKGVTGTITAMKANLVFSGTSAFVIDDCQFEMDRVGIQGSGGSGTVAVDLRGVGGVRKGGASLGRNVAVNGFHYGSRHWAGSSLSAVGSAWSGQITRCHDIAEGGQANLSEAIVTGSGGIGVAILAGAYGRLAAAIVNGHSLQGVRLEVGGSTWADFAVVGYNVAGGILFVGGTDIHFVGVRCFANGGTGINGQNGGYGRATGAILLCNGAHNVNIAQGSMEISQAISIGSSTGFLGVRARLGIENSGIGYNTTGINASNSSDIYAANSRILGNSIAMAASSRSAINATGVGLASNTQDGVASGWSEIFISGQTGGSNWSPALNTPSTDRSLISNGL